MLPLTFLSTRGPSSETVVADHNRIWIVFVEHNATGIQDRAAALEVTPPFGGAAWGVARRVSRARRLACTCSWRARPSTRPRSHHSGSAEPPVPVAGPIRGRSSGRGYVLSGAGPTEVCGAPSPGREPHTPARGPFLWRQTKARGSAGPKVAWRGRTEAFRRPLNSPPGVVCERQRFSEGKEARPWVEDLTTRPIAM